MFSGSFINHFQVSTKNETSQGTGITDIRRSCGGSDIGGDPSSPARPSDLMRMHVSSDVIDITVLAIEDAGERTP